MNNKEIADKKNEKSIMCIWTPPPSLLTGWILAKRFTLRF